METPAWDCNITLEEIRLWHTGRNDYIVLFLSVVLILGVVGNGSLLYLFVREKKLREVNNAFIINLAFADFLFVLFFVPSSIFENFFYFRPFGVAFCRILTVVTFCSHDVSILSLVVLSYFRYRAVVHPMEHFTRQSLNRTVMACIAIWFIAIFSAIFPMTKCLRICPPGFIDLHMLGDSPTYRYHMARFFLLYLFPLTVISYFYSIMAIKLISGGTRMLRRNDSTSARRAMYSRHRLGIIVVVLIVIFAVSWLPRYMVVLTLYIAEKTGTSTDTPPILQSLSNIFMALGSALNPIALYAASTMFRSNFRKHFLFCVPKSQDSPLQHATMTSLKQHSRNGPVNGDQTKVITNLIKSPNGSSS